MLNPSARRFEQLSYMEFINRQLGVMDSTAISLCMDNHLPILVFNLWSSDSLRRALFGAQVGTLIC
jgi:uridylate kinase